MATVRLYHLDGENGNLPDICMQCGRNAPHRVRKTFMEPVPWLALLCPPFYFLYYLLIWLCDSRKCLAPMCSEHTNHWRKRTIYSCLSMLAALILYFSVVATLKITETIGFIDGPYRVWIVFGPYSVGVVAVVMIQWRAIKPMEITDNLITLKNVAPAFKEAYENYLDQENKQQATQLDAVAIQSRIEPPTRRESQLEDNSPDKNDNIRPG